MTKTRHLLPAALLLLASFAHAQTTPYPETTVEDALHRMSDQAGVVFLGQVTAIRHIAGENGASGVVEVDFHVDQAVRGCTSGSVWVLREWAGLWTGGDQRYRIGQRLLMLLHPPGAAGVTSPVGGRAGAIPIRGSVSSLQTTATTTTSPAPVADLRWVGTRLQRPIAYSSTPAPLATATAGPKALTVNQAVSEASIAAQQASITVVVNMLTAWQKKNAQ
jgi:hypothetical protein